jgi:hypothetical protein
VVQQLVEMGGIEPPSRTSPSLGELRAFHCFVS